MGGFDFYCSISGSRYFDGQDEFRDAIFDAWNSDEEVVDDENCIDLVDASALSDVVFSGLLYSEGDVATSSKYVMFCPYTISEGDKKVLYADYDDPRPTDPSESNITEVFDVVPGDNPDLGDYRTEDTSEEQGFHFVAGTVIVTYSAYLILRQAAPSLKPFMVYDIIYRADEFATGHGPVDYGPVNMIGEQYVDWTAIYEGSWKRLLTQKGKTDEELLYDAWKGPGNMWVFVQPDRFPIAETMAAAPLHEPNWRQETMNYDNGSTTLSLLPLDILITICNLLPIRTTHMLICTSFRLRSLLLPQVNVIAHQHILLFEPYLLPAGPFVLNDKKKGREEIDWWEDQWAAGGILREDLNSKIPWLLYRRECSKCMSMWNRKRIWGVAKQFEMIAIESGLL